MKIKGCYYDTVDYGKVTLDRATTMSQAIIPTDAKMKCFLIVDLQKTNCVGDLF